MKTGITIIFLSVLIFTIERLTQSISTLLGKFICGDRYLQPVNGVVGDMSCGYNIDIYLTSMLLGIIVNGVMLVFILRKSNDTICLKS